MNAQFPSRSHSLTMVATLMLALFSLSSTAVAGTVSAPYTNNFSTSVSDFTVLPVARWTFLPSLSVYSNEFKSATTTASVNASNLGGAVATAKPFTLTTDFTFLNGNGTVSFLGVCFLSASDSLSTTGGYSFNYLIVPPGGQNTGIALFIKRNNTDVSSGASFVQLRNAKGTPLRFEVKGVYVDTDANGVNDALDITAKIINPANGSTATLTYRDTTPLTGSYFGMKSFDANVVTSAVNWDSFSLSNDTPKGTLLSIR